MNFSDVTTQWIIAGAILVAFVLAVVAIFAQRRNRHTTNLQTKFGEAEYARAMEQGGSKKLAESGLDERTQRVEALNIRALSSADRARFEESWRLIQARFVDGPSGAVTDAAQLMGDVMSTRGYPMSDFDQRAADISVAHPLVLENYRTAHDIAMRQAKGLASTEDLRQAMVHYRTLFLNLLSDGTPSLVKAAKA